MNSRTKLARLEGRWRQSFFGAAGLVLAANASGASAEEALMAPFTRITTGPVWSEVMQSSTVAWGDYDNDGWPDLFIGNIGMRNSLFQNNRDGTFKKVTTGPVATDLMGSTHSATWLDYDNDGWLDLAVADLSSGGNRLYRNLGGGAFARMTESEAGSIASDVSISVSISGADYDGDGLLDLFVANGALFANQQDFLYRNQGQGRFARAEGMPVTLPELSTTQGTWADYDGDGDPDLFVTHSQDHGNSLFKNDGSGAFSEVAAASGLGDVGDSTGSAWGDYDNDGDLDLLVTNLRFAGPNTRNFFYRNEGDGTFQKITAGPIAADLGHFVSAAWIDYDNDGWLDLCVTVNPPNGAPAASVKNRLYRNLGGGEFVAASAGSLVTDFANAGGAAWADYDNDGFLDVAIANGVIVIPQRNGLYRNNGNSNAWIKLKCVGTISNRSAIGTKVRVKAVIDGEERWQLRQIAGSEGWLTFNDVEILIGLGDAAQIDTIQIEWPSGVVQELHNIPVRQRLTVTENPTLSAASVGGHTLELTWLAPGHHLESTTNLSEPDWQPVPGVTGESHRMTMDQQRFFRLRKP